jgi:hypothetical protein
MSQIAKLFRYPIQLGACLLFVVLVPDASGLRTLLAAELNPKIRIAFAGDSLADNYWEGVGRLVEADPCLRESLDLLRFTRNATGLTRGDILYWPREIKQIADAFKPQLFVISIGLNDRQFILDGDGTRAAWGSPSWTAKYRTEISEFLRNAIGNNATVLVVGLPTMLDAASNVDASEKNRLFSETIDTLGIGTIRYVQPWRLKKSGPDAYSSYARIKGGRMEKIRNADGIHFVEAGEDLLAAHIFPKIVSALSDAGIEIAQCAEARSSAAR